MARKSWSEQHTDKLKEQEVARFTRAQAVEAVRLLVLRGVLEEVEPGKFRLTPGPTVEEARGPRKPPR